MQTAISHLHLLPLIRQISRNDLSGQYCISSAQENLQMLDKDYKIITRITHDSSSHLSKQPYNYALHRVEQRQRRRPNSRPAKTRLCDRSNYSKIANLAWLGSRVVSVLDSGAEGPGFKSHWRRCRVTVIGKLFTPIVPLFTKQQKW